MKFWSVLVFLPSLVWASQTALLVTSAGEIVGERQIRDLSLCGSSAGPRHILEGPNHEAGPAYAADELFYSCQSHPLLLERPEWRGSEVRALVESGDPKNRIDLVILGDGYLETQKEEFFRISQKITEDLFGHETFRTYLPLFNVYAVFVPSEEEGIGDGRPKRTAFQLYRHPSIRQAILPGNEAAAHRASRLAPGVDFPIIVANDKIYGGLGGAFAITSSSPLNLTTVLRHELGHNFGQVGEEYDGGQVYRGGNFSSSSSNPPWSHWLNEVLTPHRAELLHYSAPWKALDSSPWVQSFVVPPDKTKIFIDFNSLGFDTSTDVELRIDGRKVAYDGSFNYDRNFYQVTLDLPPGRHSIEFVARVQDGNNVLSKVGIYAMNEGYPQGTAKLGAFVTYNQFNSAVGYRPTDRNCLMRDMSKRTFCEACLETIWGNFLRQVNLIDSLTQTELVSLETLPLGMERLQIQWLDPQGRERVELANQLQWKPTAKDVGTWRARVTFVGAEVKAKAAWRTHEKSIRVQAARAR